MDTQKKWHEDLKDEWRHAIDRAISGLDPTEAEVKLKEIKVYADEVVSGLREA